MQSAQQIKRVLHSLPCTVDPAEITREHTGGRR